MSLSEPDDTRKLRLNHAELVSPNQHNALVGMAWDAYLETAARLVPDVLNTLFEHEAASPQGDRPAESGPLPIAETERGQRVREWCGRWGFGEAYAFNPAWNTLGAVNRARRAGTPVPDAFVCRWAGDRYPKWEDGRPGQRLGGIGRVQCVKGGEPLDPDGTPHPFPELAGRLVSDHTFHLMGGNGIRPMFPQEAAHMGTQVVLEPPLLYWEPTAESRAEARERIIGTLAGILDTDLDIIENAYRAHGYVNPPEKRTTEHFEWLARYELLWEKKRDIACTVGVSARHLRRELEYTASLLGIAPRIQRRGRPRRKTGITVKFSASRK